MDQDVYLNGIKVQPFTSSDDLLNYVEDKPGILVAINAEKILHATQLMRNIINRHIAAGSIFNRV